MVRGGWPTDSPRIWHMAVTSFLLGVMVGYMRSRDRFICAHRMVGELGECTSMRQVDSGGQTEPTKKKKKDRTLLSPQVETGIEGGCMHIIGSSLPQPLIAIHKPSFVGDQWLEVCCGANPNPPTIKNRQRDI